MLYCTSFTISLPSGEVFLFSSWVPLVNFFHSFGLIEGRVHFVYDSCTVDDLWMDWCL